MDIAYLVMPSYFSSISRLIVKMDADDVSTGRFDLWKQAIGYFKEYPVFGIGFKQFIRIIGLDVHNIYLQILCEMGIFGAVIYYSAMGITLYVCLQNLVRARRKHLYTLENDDYFFLLFSFIYQVFFLCYGLTGNPLYDLPTFGPYYFSIGITMFYRNDIRQRMRNAKND